MINGLLIKDIAYIKVFFLITKQKNISLKSAFHINFLLWFGAVLVATRYLSLETCIKGGTSNLQYLFMNKLPCHTKSDNSFCTLMIYEKKKIIKQYIAAFIYFLEN